MVVKTISQYIAEQRERFKEYQAKKFEHWMSGFFICSLLYAGSRVMKKPGSDEPLIEQDWRHRLVFSLMFAMMFGNLLIISPVVFFHICVNAVSTIFAILWGGSTKPPHAFDWLLFLFFLPKRDRETILGDLEESFPKWIMERGVFRANLRYMYEIITAILPVLFRFLDAIGVMRLIKEVIRRNWHQ